MTQFRIVPALGAILFAAAEPCLARDRGQDAARHGEVRTVQAIRTPEPVRVDGRLDDPAWTLAPLSSDFRQRDPLEGQPATEHTELRVAYDDEALYVAFRLQDGEPARIVRRLSRRDESADADHVRLYLDPHLDHQTGVLFEVTAAGVQSDWVIYNDSWDDSSWDAVWESAVAHDAQGWSAELRIPFSQLRFGSGERQTWGINAARFIQRKNESDWLELVPKNESGVASRMAHLDGLDALRPRRAFSFVPYVSARAERIAPAEGDPFNDGSRHLGGLGGDLKLGLTSNLTLDATVNPDFGQVEVDPAVVNLTAFETFYEEKRPFFIEGAQIFSNFGRNGANDFWGFNRSEPNLFYSRRIGRSPQGETDAEFVDRPQATTILGAAKLTGKTTSGWTLGVLDAVTTPEHADTFDGARAARPEIEPVTNYFAGRAHRDLGNAGAGLLATAVLRGGLGSALEGYLVERAYVAGLDGYRLFGAKREWAATGRLAFSRIEGSAAAVERIQASPQHYFQRPDASPVRLDQGRTSLGGWTGAANLNRNAGNLLLNAALWATSPGFESNDLGFNSRSDRWGGHVVGTWRRTTPDGFTRNRRLSIAKWYALNFDGDRQGDGINVFMNAQLKNYWFVGGNGFKRFRAQNDNLTRGGPSAENPSALGGGAFFESDVRKRATVAGEVFYASNAYGGSDLESYLTLKLKPSSSLSLQLGPSLLLSRPTAQWVTSQEDATAAPTYGARYVFGRLHQTQLSITTRFNWILSPRISLQVYAQPLISSGDYSEFKELAAPRSFDFARYGVDQGEIAYDAAAGEYRVDPDASGPAPSFTFAEPDFNFKSLRFNAVFRWEWRLGSTLYVVWTQNRTNDEYPGDFELARDLGRLLDASGDDVLLVKFTYRFGR